MTLAVFLIVFLVLYSGMHAYFLFSARSAFTFGLPTLSFLTVIFALMVVMPIMTRAFERSGHDDIALWAGYTGYIWMAFLFFFLTISILIDFVRLSLYLVKIFANYTIYEPDFLRYARFLVPCVLSAAIVCYGFYEALTIRAEKITIYSDKVPPRIGGFKILQISDVHVGLIVRGTRLEKIVEAVKKESPHILVSTGDLVDSTADGLEDAAEIFRGIQAPYGKYAVTGNHEFYAGIDKSLRFTEKAGFRVLRGDIADAGGIVIAGVDDHLRINDSDSKTSEKQLLNRIEKSKYRILLKHRPETDMQSVGLYELQLSGHAHKGQIYPFSLLVRFMYPMLAGLYDVGDGSIVYVSRGSGTWGPPIRFLAPPEITVIELHHRTR